MLPKSKNPIPSKTQIRQYWRASGYPVFRGDPMDRHQSGLYVLVTCLPSDGVHLYTLDNPNNEFPE